MTLNHVIRHLTLLLAISIAASGCAPSRWHVTGLMNIGRAGHTATLLGDGRVLVVGGFNDTGILSSAELFDPTTNQWTTTASMLTPRVRHTATLLTDGTVLVTGGIYARQYPGPAVASCERFDPASGTWTQVQLMHEPRSWHSAIRLDDGHVLVVGGGGATGTEETKNAETYDPIAGNWRPAGNTTHGHNAAAIVRLLDGNILICGGWELDGAAPVAYSQRFDSVTRTWTELAVMPLSTRNLTATVLQDGTVLATGGRFLSSTQDRTLLYSMTRFQPGLNPQPNQWVDSRSMLFERSHHQATRLRNGDVLVTGGYVHCGNDGCQSSLSSVETFLKSTGRWQLNDRMYLPRGDHTATLLVLLG